MSLDLAKTAPQIEAMASDLRERSGQRTRRLGRALEAVAAFDPERYREGRRDSEATLAWNVPEAMDSPAARYAPPPLPLDFRVVSVDGSHIEAERHMPARCFLINIGVSVMEYGSRPDADLYSRPRLYAADDELVIRDQAPSHREQNIEGAVLGAKRAVEEVRALAQVIRDLPDNVPTLALMDGSLITFGLLGHGNRDFVLRELVETGFVQALEELRQLAEARPLAVAAYTSLPDSREVVNALRLEVCPFETADCGTHCGGLPTGQRACDEAAHGLRDRDLFSSTLAEGERSGLFATGSRLVADYYQGHEIHFFYLHAGEEIGRVEVPSWVASDEASLGLAHSLTMDQCRRGPGYPVGLMESHEQAVVTGADRRHFVQLVEGALLDREMPVYSSEKARSKRLRWL